jgi:hypothetical protein
MDGLCHRDQLANARGKTRPERVQNAWGEMLSWLNTRTSQFCRLPSIHFERKPFVHGKLNAYSIFRQHLQTNAKQRMGVYKPEKTVLLPLLSQSSLSELPIIKLACDKGSTARIIPLQLVHPSSTIPKVEKHTNSGRYGCEENADPAF